MWGRWLWEGHHYLLHSLAHKKLLAVAPKEHQNPPTVDFLCENKEICCWKAHAKMLSINKVALKTILVPFVSDPGQVIMGSVLQDSGNKTCLVRSWFANQLGSSYHKRCLTVDTGTAQMEQEYAPHLIQRSKWCTVQQPSMWSRTDTQDNVSRRNWRLGRDITPVALVHGLSRSAN